MFLSSIDALGYAASLLTLVTFAQRTMLPMRIMAIGANICFIGYGAMGQFMPVLMLHLILLPINLARLRMLLRQSECEEDRPPDEATGTSATAGASSGLL
ncbi:hypothetical protein [Microvirga subterranea]|uniref:Inner membrane protein n=1 Tax=Microvirga subterranea TaxID=186651 RepID=A0A370HIF3_9HYPH|nr:hypothetical protein [Microvirga subterranea]RDI57977.1 hypothetical protein DES45_106291 [Microvirga subterranea]